MIEVANDLHHARGRCVQSKPNAPLIIYRNNARTEFAALRVVVHVGKLSLSGEKQAFFPSKRFTQNLQSKVILLMKELPFFRNQM